MIPDWFPVVICASLFLSLPDTWSVLRRFGATVFYGVLAIVVVEVLLKAVDA